MKSVFRLLICITLLWAYVMPRPVAAQDANVADCLNQDLAPAARLVACRAAAEVGNALAQNNLGVMYAQGDGVPQDYTEAVKWYWRAAEQRNAYAQNNLGVMSRDGSGVPQDDTEAVRWFRRAAEQRDAIAQNNLGVVYSNGEGVPQDYTLAHMWFNLAGTDFEHARKWRDTVAKQMTPAQIAEAQRLAREWTAAHRAGTK